VVLRQYDSSTWAEVAPAFWASHGSRGAAWRVAPGRLAGRAGPPGGSRRAAKQDRGSLCPAFRTQRSTILVRPL